MKICYKCKQEKPLTEFQKHKGKKDGVQSQCTKCYAEYQAVWYQKNKAKHIERAGSHSKQYRLDRRQKVIDYLKTHPCVDCGISDPIVLEFDHVSGEKTENVSTLVNGHRWDVVMAEIEKCEVRCANCHRKKTARDYKWYSEIVW